MISKKTVARLFVKSILNAAWTQKGHGTVVVWWCGVRCVVRQQHVPRSVRRSTRCQTALNRHATSLDRRRLSKLRPPSAFEASGVSFACEISNVLHKKNTKPVAHWPTSKNCVPPRLVVLAANVRHDRSTAPRRAADSRASCSLLSSELRKSGPSRSSSQCSWWCSHRLHLDSNVAAVASSCSFAIIVSAYFHPLPHGSGTFGRKRAKKRRTDWTLA